MIGEPPYMEGKGIMIVGQRAAYPCLCTALASA